ncbi:hypothetical protein KIN20_014940 [Parelaphostrongylus tenuis]|uniref:Uncharacterized protein n=1 Tax=Parelaphostrongylus tenuis TaxID=148309 RepID=A0AAD5QS66_PARTN|nr:hypothetical protein KIN20_014940 [Parelaphostrongylus tenuis]
MLRPAKLGGPPSRPRPTYSEMDHQAIFELTIVFESWKAAIHLLCSTLPFGNSNSLIGSNVRPALKMGVECRGLAQDNGIARLAVQAGENKVSVAKEKKITSTVM